MNHRPSWERATELQTKITLSKGKVEFKLVGDKGPFFLSFQYHLLTYFSPLSSFSLSLFPSFLSLPVINSVGVDYKSLPYDDNTFDIITFYESVCHLPEKSSFFKVTIRVIPRTLFYLLHCSPFLVRVLTFLLH